jgi:hypothetical protein
MFVLDAALGYEPWITEQNICNMYGPPESRSGISMHDSSLLAALTFHLCHRESEERSKQRSTRRSSKSSQQHVAQAPLTDYLGDYAHPTYGSF